MTFAPAYTNSVGDNTHRHDPHGKSIGPWCLDKPVIVIADFIRSSQAIALGGTADITTDVLGVGSGRLTEIATSGYGALAFTKNTDVVGIEHLIPCDCDPGEIIEYKVQWSSSDAAGTATVTGYYKPIINGTTAVVAAANVLGTALATAAAQTAPTTANVQKETAWLKIAAGTAIVKDLVPARDCIQLSFLATLSNLDDIYIKRILMRYRRFAVG